MNGLRRNDDAMGANACIKRKKMKLFNLAFVFYIAPLKTRTFKNRL